jgi:hypothetical protein
MLTRTPARTLRKLRATFIFATCLSFLLDGLVVLHIYWRDDPENYVNELPLANALALIGTMLGLITLLTFCCCEAEAEPEIIPEIPGNAFIDAVAPQQTINPEVRADNETLTQLIYAALSSVEDNFELLSDVEIENLEKYIAGISTADLKNLEQIKFTEYLEQSTCPFTLDKPVVPISVTANYPATAAASARHWNNCYNAEHLLEFIDSCTPQNKFAFSILTNDRLLDPGHVSFKLGYSQQVQNFAAESRDAIKTWQEYKKKEKEIEVRNIRLAFYARIFKPKSKESSPKENLQSPLLEIRLA